MSNCLIIVPSELKQKERYIESVREEFGKDTPVKEVDIVEGSYPKDPCIFTSDNESSEKIKPRIVSINCVPTETRPNQSNSLVLLNSEPQEYLKLLKIAKDHQIASIHCDLYPEEMEWGDEREIEKWASPLMTFILNVGFEKPKPANRISEFCLCYDKAALFNFGDTTIKIIGKTASSLISRSTNFSELLIEKPDDIPTNRSHHVYLNLCKSIQTTFRLSSIAASNGSKVFNLHFPGSPLRYIESKTTLPTTSTEPILHKEDNSIRVHQIYNDLKRLFSLENVNNPNNLTITPQRSENLDIKGGFGYLSQFDDYTPASKSYTLPNWYKNPEAIPNLIKAIDSYPNENGEYRTNILTPYIEATAKNLFLGQFHEGTTSYKVFSSFHKRVRNWIQICEKKILEIYRDDAQIKNRFLYLSLASLIEAEKAILAGNQEVATELLYKSNSFMQRDIELERNKSSTKVFKHVIAYHEKGFDQAYSSIIREYELEPKLKNQFALIGHSLQRMGKIKQCIELFELDEKLGRLSDDQLDRLNNLRSRLTNIES